MSEPTTPLRDLRRWMRLSTPVNKAGASGMRGRLPQISGPLVIGALGIGAIGAGIAWRALASTRGTGRTGRFASLIAESLDEAHVSARDIAVMVGDGFGRPSLVSVDLIASNEDDLAKEEQARTALDVLTRAVWNNPEIAPVSVRARVLAPADVLAPVEEEPKSATAQDASAAQDQDEAQGASAGQNLSAPGAQTRLIADMTALDFADEIARPDELFERYGAAASDPTWRP